MNESVQVEVLWDVVGKSLGIDQQRPHHMRMWGDKKMVGESVWFQCLQSPDIVEFDLSFQHVWTVISNKDVPVSLFRIRPYHLVWRCEVVVLVVQFLVKLKFSPASNELVNKVFVFWDLFEGDLLRPVGGEVEGISVLMDPLNFTTDDVVPRL